MRWRRPLTPREIRRVRSSAESARVLDLSRSASGQPSSRFRFASRSRSPFAAPRG